MDIDVREEVRLYIDIADRIHNILISKKMSQRDFASLLGKRESEISRWLTGAHGFTTSSLAKISAVLGEPIVEIPKEADTKYRLPIINKSPKHASEKTKERRIIVTR